MSCSGPPPTVGGSKLPVPSAPVGGRRRTQKVNWRYIRGLKIRKPTKRRQTRKSKMTTRRPTRSLRKSLRKGK
jgi:hypothetical protein